MRDVIPLFKVHPPPGFVKCYSDYYDKVGSQWYALVAIDGDGMPPQTVL